jgi:hypothetical protein
MKARRDIDKVALWPGLSVRGIVLLPCDFAYPSTMRTLKVKRKPAACSCRVQEVCMSYWAGFLASSVSIACHPLSPLQQIYFLQTAE